MTEQERTAILNLYREGKPIKEIAEATGFKPRTIYKAVSNGAIPHRRTQTVSKETAAAARAMKEEGMTLHAIAEKLKIHYETVRKVITRADQIRAESAITELEAAKLEVEMLRRKVQYLTRQLEATGIVKDPARENTWKRPSLLDETTKYDGKQRRRSHTEQKPEQRPPDSEN